MPRLSRQLSLAVLLALLLGVMPAARPGFAQAAIVVSNLTDIDDGIDDGCGADGCSLREAIRLANNRTGPNTITFSVAGEIMPLSPLPPLIDDGTTIDGGNRTVAINGALAGEANGIEIRSSGNTIRGLVIYNFTTTISTQTGAGIYINGAPLGALPARGDNNRIYGNWIGLSPAGSAAVSNAGYGIFLANGASNNIIGADNDADRNVISGNYAGGIRLMNLNTTGGLLNNNQIVGNYIGTTPNGEGVPAGITTTRFDAGVAVGAGSHNTVVSRNVIGGFDTLVADNIGAGIYVTGGDAGSATSPQNPTGTVITGNYIGVSRGGVRLANRVGIRLGGDGRYGPYNTRIGGTAAGERNVIAGNSYRGIDLPNSTFVWGDTTIAGNYIGLDGSGTRQPNGWSAVAGSGAGIYIGRIPENDPAPPGRVTVGPGNVISANDTYGIHVRSGGHVIKGNFFGTNPQGTAASLATTGNGASSILIENGSGVTVGGPSPADRNIFGASDSKAGLRDSSILINPRALSADSCGIGTPCVTGGHTIEGNYIGVAANGVTALNTRTDSAQKEGIQLYATSGNIIRNNVIGGMQHGIVLGDGTADSAANNNQIVGNKVGAPASGEIFFASYPAANQINAPRNLSDGIWLRAGSNNTIRDNLVAYNVAEGDFSVAMAGIKVGPGSAASNNLLEGNRLVRNGEFNAWGILVDGATRVRLTRNTTQFNAGDGLFTDRGGIVLANGGNGGRAAPVLSSVTAGTPPALNGSAASCSGCTVEVFGSTLATEVNEGPTFLASGTTAANGSFSIPLAVCQRYLTATVTDANGNTSAFSNQLDAGSVCTPLTLTLGAATNPNRNVAPGETTVYTHTISHNAPVSATYTVVITSSQGWASAPAFVTVPANGSASFEVSVTVPPGTPTNGSVVETTDVQVIAGLQRSNVVRDTTMPEAVTVIPATPAVSGPLTQERTGATVTFTHVVTNTGGVAGTFLVSQPAFTGAAPAGWSIAPPSPASLTLGPGVTGTLTIVVNTPTLPPNTNPVQLSFQVSVQGASPPVSVTQTDTITIPATRGFSFLPTSSEAITTPAGASVSFTYALTNTGNVEDSFSVTATPPTPAVAPPIAVSVDSSRPLSNLAPGASAAVTVTYTVPSGTAQATYSSTITATATGGANPPAPQARNVTIDVTGGAALTLTPGLPSEDPVVPGPGGAEVSFTNTLTNTGNADGPVVIGPVTGVPSGWSASVIGTTCPVSPTVLAMGASCTFEVRVTVPEGAPGGPVPLGISATAFNTPPVPNVTATAVNTVTVQIVRGVALGPDGLEDVAGPEQAITFTHTLTNTGNAADSYTLAVTSSDPGWTVSVSPTLVSDLPAGATRTVTVTATPGPGVIGGISSTLTLTATGVGGGPSASVTDTVSLASIADGDLAGGGRRNVDPGGTAGFTLIVHNTGTVPLSYTLGLSNSLPDWTAVAADIPTAVVPPGLTATLTVSVTAPLDAAPGVTNTTTVELLAGDGTGPAFDSVTVVTGIGPSHGVLIEPKGLVVEGLPNTTAVLSHTLTNIGSEQGTFRLTWVDSLGWETGLASDLVTLGPGESIALNVPIIVKPSAEAGARDFIRLRAELMTDPSISDETVDEVRVPLVFGLNLSASQVRGVRPGATTNLDSLTVFNSGSAYDTFALEVVGEDADWDVILGRDVVGINTGDPVRVAVQVRVAEGVAPGSTRTIRIEARSRSDGSVRASVELLLIALDTGGQTPDPARLRTYLPMVSQ